MLFTPLEAATEATRYFVDAAQRSILFLDTLRQRGNRTLEHREAGKPPVLIFDYETVLDAESFDRPCNYVLLRIKPPAETPALAEKRPFVIFDPRAGHGPGISGSREASQVGVALRAGHLGIFVSGRVAAREHDSLVNSLDLIDTLPPGLYEMVVDEICHEADDGTACDSYRVHFEKRTLDDIRAWDDGRADEEPFRAVARFSEINEGVYSSFVAPWVRMFTNPEVARLTRVMNPQRLRYTMFSDANPFMAGVKAGAGIVRANRVEAPDQHPMRRLERAMVESFERMISQATEQRDLAIERVFKAIWTHPLIQALAGEMATHADSKKPAASQRKALEQLRDLKLRAIAAREYQGDFADAVLRIVYAAIKAGRRVDAQAFAAAREIWTRHERFADLDRDRFIEKAREAALMVAFDEEAALRALPRLLPEQSDREDALHIVDRIIELHPDTAAELNAVRERVEALLAETAA